MNRSRRLATRLSGVVVFCTAGAFGRLAYATPATDKAIAVAAFAGACCTVAVAVSWAVAGLFRPGAGPDRPEPLAAPATR
jgi:hypothetical protein